MRADGAVAAEVTPADFGFQIWGFDRPHSHEDTEQQDASLLRIWDFGWEIQIPQWVYDRPKGVSAVCPPEGSPR